MKCEVIGKMGMTKEENAKYSGYTGAKDERGVPTSGKKPSAVAKPSRNPTPMGNAKKIESNGKKIEKLMLMLKGKGGKFTDKTAKGLADRPTVPK